MIEQPTADVFASYPLWALETIEIALREINEVEAAKCFGTFANNVRKSGKNCGAWQESFPFNPPIAEKTHLPAHEDCTPLTSDTVAAHLLDGGTFANAMPGYESRPGQVVMLRAIVDAFNAGHHVMVEAGTGVGKSLAYLVPAIAWAHMNDIPVIVSTNTRNLQVQLIEKDIPRACSILGEERNSIRVALLKGRTNYVCLRQFSILYEHAQFELTRPELRQFAEAVAWLVRSPDGDLDDFAGHAHADRTFLSRLYSTGEECAGRRCRFYRRCFLQRARAKANAAHIVIVNHALVFSEAMHAGSILPAYTQIIFDEAHNLEEVATRHLSSTFSMPGLIHVINRISHQRGKHGGGGLLESLQQHIEKGILTTSDRAAGELLKLCKSIQNECLTVMKTAGTLFTILERLLVGDTDEAVRFRCTPTDLKFTEQLDLDNVILPTRQYCVKGLFTDYDPKDWSERDLAAIRVRFESAMARLILAMDDLHKKLNAVAEAEELPLYGDQSSQVEGMIVVLREFMLEMHFVLAASDEDHVFWIEKTGRGDKTLCLSGAPLSIGSKLNELFYESKSSVVFCSATLRVGTSFNYIAKRLGIDLIETGRMTTCIAESPFDYMNQCSVLAPTFLPEPTSGKSMDYVEATAALMRDVFIRTQGRGLGLFTSYDMMNQVARILEAPLAEAGIELLVHGVNGTRDQITRRFRSGAPAVLLGTHSFWEGVDVAGEALSCVVMARLPFAVITEPVTEARCERIAQEGGIPFRDFSLPQAVIRFRQGFGRLIRTKSDRGIVIIADPRITTKNYGATFRKSIPCPVHTISSHEELIMRVDNFFNP